MRWIHSAPLPPHHAAPRTRRYHGWVVAAARPNKQPHPKLVRRGPLPCHDMTFQRPAAARSARHPLKLKPTSNSTQPDSTQHVPSVPIFNLPSSLLPNLTCHTTYHIPTYLSPRLHTQHRPEIAPRRSLFLHSPTRQHRRTRTLRRAGAQRCSRVGVHVHA
jgi:hypothetical protein